MGQVIGSEQFRISRHRDKLGPTHQDGELLSYSFILQEVWDRYLKIQDPESKLRNKLYESADAWFGWFKSLTNELGSRPEVDTWMVTRNWGAMATYTKIGKEIKIPEIVNDAGFIRFLHESSDSIDNYWFEDIYFQNYYKPLFVTGRIDRNSPHWTWFRDSFVEFRVICNLMRTIPMFWLPTMVAGQDRDFEFYQQLATVNRAIATKRLKKWRSENKESE